MKFKGVPPRRSIERRLERTLRKVYLHPFFNLVIDTLQNRVGWQTKRRYVVDEEPKEQDYAISDWIYAIGVATGNFERNIQYDDILRRVIKDEVEQINQYHKNYFVKDFWIRARVDIRPALLEREIQNEMRKVINDSVDLIKTIPQRFKEQAETELQKLHIKETLGKVKSKLKREYKKGEFESPLDLAAREKMVARVGTPRGEAVTRVVKTSDYNLRRIVRDQSNKFTGKLSQVRQQQVGVTHYRWSTSEDDRVRPTHVNKNNLVFAWNSPPPDTGHPGNDIQCRCVALAEIDINYLQSKYGKTNPSTTA